MDLARPCDPAIVGLDNDPDLIVVDHFSDQFLPELEILRRRFATAHVVAAGSSSLLMSFDRVMTLRPFPPVRGPESPGLQLLNWYANPAPQIHWSHGADLAKRCGGHPETLTIAGRLASTFGYSAVTRELDHGQRHLDALGNETSRPLQLVFDLAVNRLSDGAKSALAVLAAFNHDIPIAAISAMPFANLLALTDLATNGFVEIDRIRSTVRPTSHCMRMARTSLVANGDVDAFLDAVSEEIALSPQFMSGPDGQAWIKLAFSVTRWQLERGNAVRALSVLRILRHGIRTLKHVDDDYVPTFDKAALAAFEPEERAEALLAIGSILLFQCRFQGLRDLWEDATTWDWPGLPDHTLAEMHSQYALGLGWTGNFGRSFKAFDKALGLAACAKDRSVEMKVHYNYSLMLAKESVRLSDSLRHLDAALSILDSRGQSREGIELLVGRAMIRDRMGEDVQSVYQDLRVCLALAVNIGESGDIGEVVMNMGLALSRGDDDLQTAVHQAAGIVIAVRATFAENAQRQVKSALITLAAAMRELGRVAQARRCKALADRFERHEVFEGTSKNLERLKAGAFGALLAISGSSPSAAEVEEECLACLEALMSPQGLAYLDRLDSIAGASLSQELRERTSAIRDKGFVVEQS